MPMTSHRCRTFCYCGLDNKTHKKVKQRRDQDREGEWNRAGSDIHMREGTKVPARSGAGGGGAGWCLGARMETGAYFLLLQAEQQKHNKHLYKRGKKSAEQGVWTKSCRGIEDRNGA